MSSNQELIGRDEVHDLLSRAAVAQELEPDRSKADVDPGLGGDRAHTRGEPRDDGPDPQVVGLDGDPQAPGGGVAGDDAVRHARSVAAAWTASQAVRRAGLGGLST